MKAVKLIFLFGMTAAMNVSCMNNRTGSKPVTEITGKSSFYIINRSALDLNARYKTNGIIDSTIEVPADSTTKIFTSRGLGGDPSPASIFAKISFYKLSDVDMSSPLLTIDPIVNENWKMAGIADKAARKYERVITDKDLNN
jgi:hypothetical protein